MNPDGVSVVRVYRIQCQVRKYRRFRRSDFVEADEADKGEISALCYAERIQQLVLCCIIVKDIMEIGVENLMF